MTTYRNPTIGSSIAAHQRQLYVVELIEDVTFWMDTGLKDDFCAKNSVTTRQVDDATWYDAVYDEGSYVRHELCLPI